MLDGDDSGGLIGGYRSDCGDGCPGQVLWTIMNVPRPGGAGWQQVALNGATAFQYFPLDCACCGHTHLWTSSPSVSLCSIHTWFDELHVCMSQIVKREEQFRGWVAGERQETHHTAPEVWRQSVFLCWLCSSCTVGELWLLNRCRWGLGCYN